jgi:hypothetical protein
VESATGRPVFVRVEDEGGITAAAVATAPAQVVGVSRFSVAAVEAELGAPVLQPGRTRKT